MDDNLKNVARADTIVWLWRGIWRNNLEKCTKICASAHFL